MKRIGLIVIVLLLPLLAGCGPQGVPLPEDRRAPLAESLTEIDRLATEEALRAKAGSLEETLASVADSEEPLLKAKAPQLRLLIGYCWERLGEFDQAVRVYLNVRGSEYESVAYMRIIQVAEYVLEHDPSVDSEKWKKQALQALERAVHYPVQYDSTSDKLRGPYVLLRKPAVGTEELDYWKTDCDILKESRERVDKYYRERLIYRIFDFLVSLCSPAGENASYLLAIVVLAGLAKLITTPLSAAQFRSMQAMQKLQPEIKKLQEKYKEDKQKLARAQMELFKEAKINPLSSCLPMLIQMPILIWVYYGIRYFIFRFENIRFLYIDNLANPDVLQFGDMLFPGPLLLLYGVSMYFSQKLIATPAATPEQEQQQKLMAYMMPLLLVFVLKGLSAAFILYWFLQNILMTGHQFLIMRSRAQAESGGDKPTDSGGIQAGPPEAAIEKLAQGSRRPKKKKRK